MATAHKRFVMLAISALAQLICTKFLPIGSRLLDQIGEASHYATPTRIIGAGNPGKRALQALTIQRIIRNSAQLISNRSLIIRRHR